MSIAPSKGRAKPPAGRVHGSNRRVRAPGAQGLYDPRFEHDACGVGFVVDIQGRRSHRILEQALGRIFGLTAVVAAVAFAFWFIVIHGPGPTLAPKQ